MQWVSLIYFQGLVLHCTCSTFLQDSFSSCSILAADSNQGHLSSEESLLPKIKRPPWGQTLSNDWQSSPHSPPVSFSKTLKSTPASELLWNEAFVENGPPLTSVSSYSPHVPTRTSLRNFLHRNLQMRVCSGKLGLWLCCLQRHVKPRYVSQ